MPMTGTEGAALAEIKRLEKAGALRYDWNHAIPRMEERGATRADVRHALASSTDCRLGTGSNDGHFEVMGGVDLDGESLNVVVEIRDGIAIVYVWVITVFER